MMKDGCTQSCGTCAEECADRKEEQADFMARLHAMSSVKKVIGIVSGKGGVGKSLVTSLLAVNMARKGYHCAILDADITGPSIPKAFGLKGQVGGTEQGIMPLTSATGIDVMSINLLMENETDPVIWRGPIIGNVVKQFWTDVIWKNIDFMFIDMPPGTGDVPLTVFQSLPVDGIVIVTSPQELVSMIVAKAVNMAKEMHIPILGLVENMSYFRCPDNGKEYKIFGESHIDTIAKNYGLPILAKLPIEPALAEACDAGQIESVNGDWMDTTVDMLGKMAKSVI
ncbi:Protein mrp homolog [uncultured delta proteobacterium]|uniref:Iron-sulfur cluster carrier protein n=1 Tax=uncultured delta proteobacterium TaxID=34034 RepID=A0A212KG36_9DELT|nr:Protein mrp homolog [uncultured delta proteobacterium]